MRDGGAGGGVTSPTLVFWKDGFCGGVGFGFTTGSLRVAESTSAGTAKFLKRASNSETVEPCRLGALLTKLPSLCAIGAVSAFCSETGLGFSSGLALISGLGLISGFALTAGFIPISGFSLICGFALISGLVGEFSDVEAVSDSAPTCRPLRAASSPRMPACIGFTTVCVGLTAESAVDCLVKCGGFFDGFGGLTDCVIVSSEPK